MANFYPFFSFSGKFNFIPNILIDKYFTIKELNSKGKILSTHRECTNYVLSILREEMLPFEHASNALKKETNGAAVGTPYKIIPRDRYGYFVDHQNNVTKSINTYAVNAIYYFPKSIVDNIKKITKSDNILTEQLRMYTYFVIGHERAHSTQKIVGEFLISDTIRKRYKKYVTELNGRSLEERHADWCGWAFAKRRMAVVETTF